MSRSATLPPTSVLVVDDHGIVREGVCVLLAKEKSLTVVGSASTGTEAIAAAARHRPDVIVMDLMLPDMNGIDAAQQILTLLPQTRIVVLSACHTLEHVHRAMRAGAHGYVIKGALAAELVNAVHAVAVGKQYLSDGIALAFPEIMLGFDCRKSPLERLSFRERDVLRRVVAGASSTQIGQQLSLSPKTIDTYRGRLMTKLGVPNRSALIRFAIEHELAVL
jgi:DNA-binding NarL/FixJ family response regulator